MVYNDTRSHTIIIRKCIYNRYTLTPHSTRGQWQYVMRHDAFLIDKDEAHTFLEPILICLTRSQWTHDRQYYVLKYSTESNRNRLQDGPNALKIVFSSNEYIYVYQMYIVLYQKYNVFVLWRCAALVYTVYWKYRGVVYILYAEELSAKSPQLNARNFHIMYIILTRY